MSQRGKLLRVSRISADRAGLAGLTRVRAVRRKLSDEEKDAYIRLHPAYGRIVCRCETVSEGEILDALRREPRALDLDGVKRRTRSGMGRCQGGFCSPHILGLLAKELGIPMEQVTKSGSGSNLLTGRL